MPLLVLNARMREELLHTRMLLVGEERFRGGMQQSFALLHENDPIANLTSEVHFVRDANFVMPSRVSDFIT